MDFTPMDMKKRMIENSIEDIRSGNRNQKIDSIEFLGKTIGIGEDFGLETEVLNVINACLSNKNRRIRKAAEESLELINQRKPSSMFDNFQGGVGFSSKK